MILEGDWLPVFRAPVTRRSVVRSALGLPASACRNRQPVTGNRQPLFNRRPNPSETPSAEAANAGQ
jgi:hypothetical protein